MVKHSSFSPSPIKAGPLRPGAQNASQDAHLTGLEEIKNQTKMNNMTGGTICPQSPMYGMKAGLMSANATSCSTNGTHAQQHSNAAYDSLVGRLPPKGGNKRKYKKRSKTTRKSRKNLKKRTPRRAAKSRRRKTQKRKK